MLYFVFDASLSLGPISLGLLGFGFRIKLDGSIFKNPQLDVTLSGFGRRTEQTEAVPRWHVQSSSQD